MPPSTTIESTTIDSQKVNDSGETKPWNAENMPPATPPNDAPIANASSLMLRVLMPIALAAVSSSRTAIHALPMRECCRRTHTNAIRTAKVTNR
ncbi:hypothetical protein PSP31120_03638 [Pandoraea sputorum]|nr:hypothetical protein PSP31120_03638 [Pandoraea sputorum]